MKKYDPNTMTLDSLFELHSSGEKVGCPVCGAELQISVETRRTAFCPTDREHVHLMPTTVDDRREIDALLDGMRNGE